jgi:hypothetical protein
LPKEIEQRGSANRVLAAYGFLYVWAPRVIVKRFQFGAGLSQFI